MDFDPIYGFPIILVKGTDFYLPINYVIEAGDFEYPVNLTGYTARMQIRSTIASTGTPLVDISTEDGTISIDGLNGKIELNIPKSITVDLPAGVWAYDCLVTNVSDLTEQIIFGSATVLERTTK